jgi:Spy/CpxP family protein refolding chaperone
MKTKLMNFLLFTFFFGAMLASGTAQTPPVAPDTSDAQPHLTAAQLQSIKSIHTESEKKAAPLALRLALAAKRIYENMLSEKEDEALRQRLSREMDEVVVGMLAIKGQSIREIVRVLTPEQRQLVRSEMQKPGAPGDLSELIMRVFNVPEK